MASKGKYIMIGIGFAVAAVIAVIFMAGALAGGKQVNPLTSYIGQKNKENIVNGIVTVPSRGYQSYQFMAPDGSTDISVNGNFEATGGSGNDIKVFIMDNQAFTNWKNGHSVSTYYSSGQLTTDTVTKSVPAGQQMVLVFDNSFSSFSSKQVKTTFDLTYTK